MPNEEWVLSRGWADWGMSCEHSITQGPTEIARIPSVTPYCMGASAKDVNYAAQQWKNALLLAAAPDLLAALKAALPAVESAHKDATLTKNSPSEWWAWHEELQLIRAAIEKAEGKDRI
jgi:hypothetical protein